MSRSLLLAALAALLACAAAHPVTDACAGHQDKHFGVKDNLYQDTASKNFVEQAFEKLEPWLVRDVLRKGIVDAGCKFSTDVKRAACYTTVGRDAHGKAVHGEYGFEFELDFMCPEGINGPDTVMVLKHYECQAVAYTNRNGSWWAKPDYTCQ